MPVERILLFKSPFKEYILVCLPYCTKTHLWGGWIILRIQNINPITLQFSFSFLSYVMFWFKEDYVYGSSTHYNKAKIHKRCKFDTKSLKFHDKNTLEGNLSGWFLCGWFSRSYAFWSQVSPLLYPFNLFSTKVLIFSHFFYHMIVIIIIIITIFFFFFIKLLLS